MKVSLKELRETMDWLKITKRANLLPAEDIAVISAETNELISIFVASIRTAQTNL